MALEALRDVLIQGGRDYFNMTRSRVDEERARAQRERDLADQREYFRQQQAVDRQYSEGREREKMILGIMEKTGMTREEATAALDSGQFGKAVADASAKRALDMKRQEYFQSLQFNEVGALRKDAEELSRAQAALALLNQSESQIKELASRPEAQGMDLRKLSGDAIAKERAQQLYRQYTAMSGKDEKGADAWLLHTLNYDPKAKADAPAEAALKADMNYTSGGRFMGVEDAKAALLSAADATNLTVDPRVQAASLLPSDRQNIEIAKLEFAQRSAQDRTEGSVVRTQLAGLIAQRNAATDQLIKVGYNPTLPVDQQPAVISYNQRRAKLPSDLQQEVPELSLAPMTGGGYFTQKSEMVDVPAPEATSSGVALPGLGIVTGKPGAKSSPAPEAPVYFGPGGAEDADPYRQERDAQNTSSVDWWSIGAPLAAAGSAYALSPAGQDAMASAGKAVARGAVAGGQAAAKTPALLARGAEMASDAAARGYVGASNAAERALAAGKDYFTKLEPATSNRFGVGGIEEAMRQRSAAIADAYTPAKAAAAEAGAATRAAAHATRAEAAAARAGMRFAHPSPVPLIEKAAEKRAASAAAKIASERAAKRASAMGALRVAGATAGPVAQAALTGFTIGEVANMAGGAGLNTFMSDGTYRSEGIGQTLGDAYALPSREEQDAVNEVDALIAKRKAILEANIPLAEKQRLAAPLTARINSAFATSSYFNQTR